MTNVLVLGGVSFNTMIYLDRFPAPRPQTVYSRAFHETVGSTGAGKALNLHRLGFQVLLHGLIGEDDHGQRVRAYFDREGIPFLHELDPQGTPRHVNLMNDDGGRISIFIVPGTFEPLIDLGRIEAVIPSADYVALNIVNYCRRSIPLLKKHRKEIWCDIHDYDGENPFHQDFIDAADVLLMSSNAMPDCRPFMERVMVQGKKLVVCTHGREGATALAPGGRWFEAPSLPYPVRDTNGAGDSFFAGLLYGHTRGYDWEKALRMGAVAAGLCVSSLELASPDLSVERIEGEYRKHFPPG